jgi:hypothetical protein
MEVVVKIKIHQFADERVTLAKFERQVNDFETHAAAYRKEGVISLKIKFPVFEFAFLARETLIPTNLQANTDVNSKISIYRPVPFFIFAIRLDYSNFDVSPPSLRVINPFTSELDSNVGYPPFITPHQQNQNSLIDPSQKLINQNILLTDNDGRLFICLRGLKEYHEHPHHNGDSWFLYRIKGKGNIINVLDQLQLYAISNFNKLASQQKKIQFKHG